MHTGTGRISRMIMRTMSLLNPKDSTGEISLSELFDGKNGMLGESEMTVERLAEALVRGGSPEAVNEKNKLYAKAMVYNYLDAVTKQDMSNIDNIERNPDRVYSLLSIPEQNEPPFRLLRASVPEFESQYSGI